MRWDSQFPRYLLVFTQANFSCSQRNLSEPHAACLLHQRNTSLWPPISLPFSKAKVSVWQKCSPWLPSGQCGALCFHTCPTYGILPSLPVLACTQHSLLLLMHQVAGGVAPCVWWRDGVMPAMLPFALEVDPLSWPVWMHIGSNYWCHFKTHRRQEAWVASSWNYGNLEK